MSTRRYKNSPMKPIPATHEPLVVDFTFSGSKQSTQLTFFCASHFKRVNVRDEGFMIGHFVKIKDTWHFSSKIVPSGISDSDMSTLTSLVFEYFDAGWED
jgi:hypothetical protein